jgi:hypothetical protein
MGKNNMQLIEHLLVELEFWGSASMAMRKRAKQRG